MQWLLMGDQFAQSKVGCGHLAEFNKRLLIGNLLRDPKADTHVCRLPAHCDIRVQAFLKGIAFVQLYKVSEFRGMSTFRTYP